LRLLDNTTAFEDLAATAGLTAEAIRLIQPLTLLLYGERTRFLGTFKFLEDNLPTRRACLVPNRGHQLPLIRPAVLIESLKAFWRDPDTYLEPSDEPGLLEAALPARARAEP